MTGSNDRTGMRTLLPAFGVALVLWALSAKAGETVDGPAFPGGCWATAAPAAAGVQERLLEGARDYALRGGGSGYIVRDGRLLYSWGDPHVLYDLKSTTKSIGITALGLALKDGLVGLDDTARTYLPDIGVPPEENLDTGWLGSITIRHLATHSAGFDKRGGYAALLFEPGSAFAYSDAGMNWLADVLTVRFGVDLQELLSARIFEPLGIGSADLTWREHHYRYDSVAGITRREFGSGMHASVDALARIGYLYLRDGVWDGERILPEGFVERLRRPDPGLAGLPVVNDDAHAGATDHYGLAWWNNADGSVANVPRDAYWSWGLGDSFIIVIPSLDLVVVRAGDGWRREWDTDYGVLQPFLEPIVEAVARPTARPEGEGMVQRAGQPVDHSAGGDPVPAEAPYPKSTFITGIEWAPAATVLSDAEDSDTWPLTWADDGDLYTAYGDGWGFVPKPPEKLSLGYARISASPPEFTGVNIPSPTGEHTGSRHRGKKASGMLMVDGRLYQWVRNANENGEQCQLAVSGDRAASWAWSEWQFAEFGYCAFLNFGRDYAGARDGFVYMYAADTPTAYQSTSHLVLTRVPKEAIPDRDAYEFFQGLDTKGNPLWTTEINERRPVFAFADGVNRFDVTYNPPLGRYLMTMRSGAVSEDEGLDRFSLFEGPEPWGPWSTVYHTDRWEGEPSPSGIADWGEAQHIPAKWISADGTQFYLVFSGGDSFAVRRATLTVAEQAAPLGGKIHRTGSNTAAPLR